MNNMRVFKLKFTLNKTFIFSYLTFLVVAVYIRTCDCQNLDRMFVCYFNFFFFKLQIALHFNM